MIDTNKYNIDYIGEKVLKPIYEDGNFPLTLADQIKDAIENAIPKKIDYVEPTHVKAFDGVDKVETYKCYPCPTCGKWITEHNVYCQYCGQKIDWDLDR